MRRRRKEKGKKRTGKKKWRANFFFFQYDKNGNLGRRSRFYFYFLINKKEHICIHIVFPSYFYIFQQPERVPCYISSKVESRQDLLTINRYRDHHSSPIVKELRRFVCSSPMRLFILLGSAVTTLGTDTERKKKKERKHQSFPLLNLLRFDPQKGLTISPVMSP